MQMVLYMTKIVLNSANVEIGQIILGCQGCLLPAKAKNGGREAEASE